MNLNYKILMKKKVASKVDEEKNKTNQEIKVCNIEETNQFLFTFSVWSYHFRTRRGRKINGTFGGFGVWLITSSIMIVVVCISIFLVQVNFGCGKKCMIFKRTDMVDEWWLVRFKRCGPFYVSILNYVMLNRDYI